MQRAPPDWRRSDTALHPGMERPSPARVRGLDRVSLQPPPSLCLCTYCGTPQQASTSCSVLHKNPGPSRSVSAHRSVHGADSSVRIARDHNINRIKRDSTNIISELRVDDLAQTGTRRSTPVPRQRRAERTEGWNLELGDGHAHLPHGRIRRFTLPWRTPAVEAPHASKSRRPKSPVARPGLLFFFAFC